MTLTLRALCDGRSFVPLDPVHLAAGGEVQLQAQTDAEPAADGDAPAGSPAAVLKALRSLPPLDPGTADLFLRSLAEAKADSKPADDRGVFDDLV